MAAHQKKNTNIIPQASPVPGQRFDEQIAELTTIYSDVRSSYPKTRTKPTNIALPKEIAIKIGKIQPIMGRMFDVQDRFNKPKNELVGNVARDLLMRGFVLQQDINVLPYPLNKEQETSTIHIDIPLKFFKVFKGWVDQNESRLRLQQVTCITIALQMDFEALDLSAFGS